MRTGPVPRSDGERSLHQFAPQCPEDDGWFYAPEADLIQVVVKEPGGTWAVGDRQPKESS